LKDDKKNMQKVSNTQQLIDTKRKKTFELLNSFLMIIYFQDENLYKLLTEFSNLM